MTRLTSPIPFSSRLLSCAIALLVAPAAFAESPLSDKGQIEEVLIYGEKTERSLQDTVSSVGVMTQTQIDESAIYDIQDVFDRMANVNGSQGNEGFAIRGINHSTVTGSGGLNTVGLASLHIDGAVMSSLGIRAGQVELWDMAQVEVFRGPQSTNQGRNSLAGAIVMRSADPTYEWDAKYRAYYAQNNTHAASVAFGDALIEDELAYRVAIDTQETDGFIKNPVLNDDDYGGSSNTTIRGKLLWEPASIEGLSVLTTLSYSKNEAGDPIASLIDADSNPTDPYKRKAYANIVGFDNNKQSIATVEVNYELNDEWKLTSISSGNRSDYERQSDADAQATGGPALRTRKTDTDVFSQELRLNFDYQRLQGNVGAYYYNLNQDSQIDDLITQNLRAQVTQLVPILAPTLASFAPAIANLYDDPFLIGRKGGRGSDIENWAVFANVDYQLSDFVTLFAGLRYDEEKVSNYASEQRTAESSLPNPSDSSFPISAGVTQVNQLVQSQLTVSDLNDNTTYDALLPKVGVTLNWSDDLATSFSVQRGYRAGGSGTSTSGAYEYDPEFTTNYEFSLRSQWFDQRLTVNANLFYIDWQDQQVLVSDPIVTTDFLTTNAGESDLRGLELEVVALPSDGLELYFNLGYTKTEFTDFPADTQLGNDDFTGHEFIEAPRLNSAMGFVWNVNDALRWQADINYRDSAYDNIENNIENDSRTVVNSKLSYEFGEGLQVSLIARNLFDRDYITRGDVTSSEVVTVSEPRTVGLQIQGSW